MRILKKFLGKGDGPAKTDESEPPISGVELEPEKKPESLFEEKLIITEPSTPIFIPFENNTDWVGSDTEQAEAVKIALSEYVEAYLFSEAELNQAQKYITQGKLNKEKSKTTAEKLSSTIGRDYDMCNDMVRTVETILDTNLQVQSLIEMGCTQYKVVCHLDKKTCSRCSKQDLKVYDLADGPKPPFHKNCRCRIVSAISDDADVTRPAKNGEGKAIKVPSTMTYAEWRQTYWPELAPVTKSVETNKPERKPLSDGIDWGLPNIGKAGAVNDALLKYEDADRYTDEELEKAKKIIIQGIMDGMPYKDTATKLSNATGREFDECHDLVRTVDIQANVDSEMRSLKECGQTEYQISCCLDKRTCPLCGQYDQKIYSMDKGPKPPFHKNCRCMVGIVMPTDPNLKRGASDENDVWIRVPHTMTWSEWRQIYAFRTGPPEPNHKKV